MKNKQPKTIASDTTVTSHQTSSKRTRGFAYCVLVVILLFGVVLRLIGLSDKPMDPDQGMHLHNFGWLDAVLFDLPMNPPLFRVLVQVAGAISRTAFAARMVPVLAGICSVLVVFLLAKRLAGLDAALMVAFWLAVSPWHVRHSQTLRAYSLWTLLSLLGMLLTVVRLQSPEAMKRKTYLFTHTIIQFLAVSTHYFAFITVGLELGLMLLKRRTTQLLIQVWVLVVTGLGYLTVVWQGAATKLSSGPAVTDRIGFDYLTGLLKTVWCTGGISWILWLTSFLFGLFGPLLYPRFNQLIQKRQSVSAALTSEGSKELCLSWCVFAQALLLPVSVAIMSNFLMTELRYSLPALPILFLACATGLRNVSQLIQSFAGQTVSTCTKIVIFFTMTAGLAGPLKLYLEPGHQVNRLRTEHLDLVHEEVDMEKIGSLIRTECRIRDTCSIVSKLRGPGGFSLVPAIFKNTYPGNCVIKSDRGVLLFDCPNYKIFSFQGEAQQKLFNKLVVGSKTGVVLVQEYATSPQIHCLWPSSAIRLPKAEVIICRNQP